MAAVRSGRVWVLAFIYFGFIYGLYALAFFLPTIISGFQEQFGTTFDVFEKGLITAIPYLPAAVVLYLWSRDATKRGVQDLAHRRTRIRRRTQRACRAVHGFTGRHHRGDHRDGMRHLRRTSQLLDGARKVPHRRGSRRGHRADQHLRQRGGFAAGYVTGFLKDLTGSYVVSMFVVGGLMVLSGVLMVMLTRWGRVEPTGPEAESDPGTQITATGPVR